MTETIERSDLYEWAHHGHEHMGKLFDDLRGTFNAIATGELVGQAQEVALGQALEDLEGALEDMLEHFGEEEELYFVAIEQRFGEMSHKLDELVAGHERICARTRKLQRHVASQGDLREASGMLIALVNELALDIERHNEREHEVFGEALSRMSDEDKLDVMRSGRTRAS